jgi:hypothetical protein
LAERQSKPRIANLQAGCGFTWLRHRPACVALTEPAAATVPLQGHAEVVRPYLHAELFPKIDADLLGRDLVPKRLDSAQCGIAQR